MNAELTTHNPSTDLAQQMDYARAVSTGSLLPQAYRGKPADILLAVGLGQAMGLSPAESLYRIDVIQGKPTASAELIAANVRKAGHKLRVHVDESGPSATATIVRADDPDYEHTITRDAAWAKRMGLDGKDNYRKQPATMLQWRAISAVARMACPEALYGVAYTPDEMQDVHREAAPERARVSAADFGVAPVDAEVVEDPPADDGTDRARRRMFALFNERGITDKGQQLAGISKVLGRDVASRADLTGDDLAAVIASLTGDPS